MGEKYAQAAGMTQPGEVYQEKAIQKCGGASQGAD